MKTTKSTGRLIGLLFLLMFIPGSIGVFMRGVTTAIVESPEFLQTVHEGAFNTKISVMFDMMAGLLGITIAVKFFPVLKEYSQAIAYGYIGLWVAQFGIGALSNVKLLTLLALSADFVTGNTAGDAAIYNSLGQMAYNDWLWAHFLSLIIFAIGGTMMYYALFRARLVPRILAVWGILAVGTVFTATVLQIFDYKVSFMLYMQNGIHLITFSVWLIIMGFRSPKQEYALDR